jgi:hypothetical protein
MELVNQIRVPLEQRGDLMHNLGKAKRGSLTAGGQHETIDSRRTA